MSRIRWISNWHFWISNPFLPTETVYQQDINFIKVRPFTVRLKETRAHVGFFVFYFLCICSLDLFLRLVVFMMFSSRYLLITDLKPLVDCPCFVPAFVFHQAFNFQISWIWPFCGILACLLMFFWYFYGLLLDHWFEPRFRLPMTHFNWISPNSTLTDSLSVLLWPFWWILPSLLMFFWCLPLTNLWSLVWNNRFFSSIRFNSLFHLWFFPLRIISAFFDVLPNVCGFLWFFLWSIHFDLWYETSIADCW